MKAEQLFEKFKVLNEDYKDKMNIAKNKADHSKEALAKEREKAIETFNKSKKSFEEVFGKGEPSKEFTNMNNLQKNKENTSLKTQLQNAYERVYDELKTLINLANGDTLGISNKKQINDDEYKTMVKRLFVDIDKAAAIESRVPAKYNFEPYMPKLRKQLQGESSMHEIDSKTFPNTKISGKLYARTDLFPKVAKQNDIYKDINYIYIELDKLRKDKSLFEKRLEGLNVFFKKFNSINKPTQEQLEEYKKNETIKEVTMKKIREIEVKIREIEKKLKSEEILNKKNISNYDQFNINKKIDIELEKLENEKIRLEKRLRTPKNEFIKKETEQTLKNIEQKIKELGQKYNGAIDKKKIVHLDKFTGEDLDSIDEIENVRKNRKSFIKTLTDLGNLIPSVKEKRNDITKDFEVADLKGSQDKEKLSKLNEISKKKFQDYISGNEKSGKEESEEELEVSSKKLAKELEDLDSSNIKSKNAQNHAQYQWQKENAKRKQNEELNKAAGFNNVDEVLDKAGIPSVMVKKLLGHSIKFYGNIPSPAGGTFDQLKGYLVLADANKIGGKDSKFVVNIDGKDWYGYKIGKQYRSVKIAETEETRKMHEGEKDVLFIYKATSDEKEKIREVFDSKFKKASVKTTFKYFNY